MRPDNHKLIQALVAFAIVFAGGFQAIASIADRNRFWPHDTNPTTWALLVTLRIILPAAVALIVMRMIQQRPILPARPKFLVRPVLILVAFGYLGTIVFGIPAILTQRQRTSVGVYK